MRKVVRKLPRRPPGERPPQPFAPPEADIEPGEWINVQVIPPEPKKLISLRLDPEVLHFFQRQGKGYQTRINAVLRAYMKAHQSE